MDTYGKEVVLDLEHCNPKMFTRDSIKQYCILLCELIDMEREDLYFWDYEDPEEYNVAPNHLKGTSAVQFIRTSNITIHTLDVLQTVYLNVFSCKDFDIKAVIEFSKKWFGGEIKRQVVIPRG